MQQVLKFPSHQQFSKNTCNQFLYCLPALSESFGLQPLSSKDWIEVLKWSVPILALDEALKWVGRQLAKQKAVEDEEEERMASVRAST